VMGEEWALADERNRPPSSTCHTLRPLRLCTSIAVEHSVGLILLGEIVATKAKEFSTGTIQNDKLHLHML
jgi:hypothetical protein